MFHDGVRLEVVPLLSLVRTEGTLEGGLLATLVALVLDQALFVLVAAVTGRAHVLAVSCQWICAYKNVTGHHSVINSPEIGPQVFEIAKWGNLFQVLLTNGNST